MATKTFANKSAAYNYIVDKFNAATLYVEEEYLGFKTDVQGFIDGEQSYGSGYTFGYSVPEIIYDENNKPQTTWVDNGEFGFEYANWANGWGYYSGARNGPYAYWGKDTGDLIENFLDKGIELTYLADVIELNGPEAKDYEALNPETGEGLVLPVGTTVEGLSFGEKLTELVVDNYPYYTFEWDNFTLDSVVIGGETYAYGTESGISADADGIWTVDTTLDAYTNLQLASGETEDVTVNFTVTGPNGKTDSGTVDFDVVGAGQADNVELNTRIERAGEISSSQGWKISSDYSSNTLVTSWQFGNTVDTDVISNNSNADIFAASADHDSLSSDNYYVASIDAETTGDYNINSLDVNFTFDATKFEWVGTKIDGKFDTFNAESESLDVNGQSTIRIVGGSAQDLTNNAGGITKDGSDKTAFQILLKSIHDSTKEDNEESIEFKTSVNSTDTILTSTTNKEDIINGTAQEETDSYSFENSFIDFNIQNDVSFATQRTIGFDSGTSQYTSIVRAGDSLTSLGSVTLSTEGNVNTNFKAELQGAQTSTFDINFDETTNPDKGIDGNVSHDNSTQDYDLTLKVAGQAGQVIDLDGVSVKISDQEDRYAESTDLAGKNLITYQSDINYDGRVSMADLAYLNAGAARNTNPHEVDVNYDGEISLNDLAKMDEEWGSSLHTNALVNDSFAGTNQTSIDLTAFNNISGTSIDNSSFISQNAIEQAGDFVGSLSVGGSQNYVDTSIQNNASESSESSSISQSGSPSGSPGGSEMIDPEPTL